MQLVENSKKLYQAFYDINFFERTDLIKIYEFKQD